MQMMLLVQDHILGYYELDYTNILFPGLPAYTLACIIFDDNIKIRNLKQELDHTPFLLPLLGSLILPFFSMDSHNWQNEVQIPQYDLKAFLRFHSSLPLQSRNTLSFDMYFVGVAMTGSNLGPQFSKGQPQLRTYNARGRFFLLLQFIPGAAPSALNMIILPSSSFLQFPQLKTPHHSGPDLGSFLLEDFPFSHSSHSPFLYSNLSITSPQHSAKTEQEPRKHLN